VPLRDNRRRAHHVRVVGQVAQVERFHWSRPVVISAHSPLPHPDARTGSAAPRVVVVASFCGRAVERQPRACFGMHRHAGADVLSAYHAWRRHSRAPVGWLLFLLVTSALPLIWCLSSVLPST